MMFKRDYNALRDWIDSLHKENCELNYKLYTLLDYLNLKIEKQYEPPREYVPPYKISVIEKGKK